MSTNARSYAKARAGVGTAKADLTLAIMFLALNVRTGNLRLTVPRLLADTKGADLVEEFIPTKAIDLVILNRRPGVVPAQAGIQQISRTLFQDLLPQ